jgi:uncharacterized protein
MRGAPSLAEQHQQGDQDGQGKAFGRRGASTVTAMWTAGLDSLSGMPAAIRMHYNGVVFSTVRDSEWSADHIAAHGVTLDEVREAILERPFWVVPGRDGTALVYGRTYAGRYLLVVALLESDEAFIITARDMTAAEKKTFRRKAR